MKTKTNPFYYIPNSVYKVSTSVGSGKTYAAIRYMAESPTQNMLYVAPTLQLVNQTAEDLRQHLVSHSYSSRRVHLIHAESKDDERSTAEQALDTLHNTFGNIGATVIITTTTFLRILPRIKNKEDWTVILDEAFSAVNFQTYNVGKDNPEAGKAYFRELFALSSDPSPRVTSAEGKSKTIANIAAGDTFQAGQRFAAMRSFCEAVSNPAIHCEIAQEREEQYTMATYVTPDHFRNFESVIFLAALFEESVLYALWSEQHWINFQSHEYFDEFITRDVHRDQGRLCKIGYLLDDEDNSSRYNYERHRDTGEVNLKREGDRVIDAMIEIVSAYFGDDSYLLQVNNWVYRSSKKAPSGAKRIPVHAHGLNKYKDYNNVAALAVTNPSPQEADWVQRKTGMSSEQVHLMYRLHTTYQALGRCSIRDANCTKEKVFIVPSKVDAEFFLRLFEGSTSLGKIGNLGSLKLKAEQLKKVKGRLKDDRSYEKTRRRIRYLKSKAETQPLSGDQIVELKKLEQHLAGLKRDKQAKKSSLKAPELRVAS